MSKRGNRTDANTKAIREAVRQVGGVWIDLTGDPSIGMDALIAFRGRVWLCELKDGEKAPSQRKLTEREEKRINELAWVNVPVHVVLSRIDVLKLIGATK